jgi:predicted RNA binding protein YcfA (HicA-like mRNA interferase family)
MNPPLPVCRPDEVVAALERGGWVRRRQAGSHLILHHAGQGRRIAVPIHRGRDVPTGTLRAIIRNAGLTVEEFIELLER